MAVTQAVILCGGLGTRMGELTKNTPKPMLPVAGKPVLEHTIEFLKQFGITDFLLAARYKSDVISNYFGDGSALGVRISVSVEQEPLGTAGPLTLLADKLNDSFLVLYGDEFIDFDVGAMIAQHEQQHPLASVLLRPSTHPWDAHLVQTDAAGRMTGFIREREQGVHYRNLGNGAVYICSKAILNYIPKNRPSGFAEDVFNPAIAAGEHLQGWVMNTGFIKDLASPDRLKDVERYLRHKEEIAHARIERKPIQAIFLDRDGVLNEDNDLIDSPNRLVMLAGAGKAVKLFNDAGMKTVLVTNQPVIARGLCSHDSLSEIHEKLQQELSRDGASLDAIYYCPHHPETHHGDGVVELRRACDCRKPKPGMLLQAKDDHHLDLGACVMIGDSSTDIAAGHAAGVRTILLDTGMGRVDNKGPAPDYRFGSLLDAAQAITRGDIK